MIERHRRVKDLGGASGFLPNTPFILLILLRPGVRQREVFVWAMYDFANSGYTTVGSQDLDSFLVDHATRPSGRANSPEAAWKDPGDADTQTTKD